LAKTHRQLAMLSWIVDLNRPIEMRSPLLNIAPTVQRKTHGAMRDNNRNYRSVPLSKGQELRRKLARSVAVER
jgi:hypothetical protein